VAYFQMSQIMLERLRAFMEIPSQNALAEYKSAALQLLPTCSVLMSLYVCVFFINRF